MNASPATPVDISIIILTFNTWDLTRACVRSAIVDANSTDYSFEIVVVDNASTDDTANKLRAEFRHVKVIENTMNLGFSRGNNIGLGIAQGRYLLLLNSDTELESGICKTLIEFMDTHTEAGACGPMLLNSDGSLQPSGRRLPSLWSVLIGMTKLYRLWKQDFYREHNRDYTKVVRVGEVSGAAILVRRQVYDHVGGLDEHIFAYYEDVDWCKRIGDAGYAIYYVPTAKVVHHWRGTSSTVSELSYRAAQNSQRYYFNKHHGAVAHVCIQILLVSKELILIAVFALRGNSNRRRFHQRMLRNVLQTLDPSIAFEETK